MKTLAMDTAWNDLVIALFEDGKLVAGSSEKAPRRQSEQLNVRLKQLLDQAGWKLRDVEEVVITDGPGSYTGLRIAMTAAKIIGTQQHIPVRTLSLMQLYAGNAENALVVLDARGRRAYRAKVHQGNMESMEIVPVEQAVDEAKEAAEAGSLYGDVHLFEESGLEVQPSDFLANFESVLPLAQAAEDVSTLVPRYYKESSSYLV